MMHQNTVVWKEFFFSPSRPVKSAQKHMQNINNGCLENSKIFTKACEFRRLCCELQQLEFTDYVRRNMVKVCVGSWCVKKKRKREKMFSLNYTKYEGLHQTMQASGFYAWKLLLMKQEILFFYSSLLPTFSLLLWGGFVPATLYKSPILVLLFPK